MMPALCLEHLPLVAFGIGADRIERAVRKVLAAGNRTGDIALPGEKVIGLAPLGEPGTASPGLALGTRSGVVKVCAPEWPVRSDAFEVISLREAPQYSVWSTAIAVSVLVTEAQW